MGETVAGLDAHALWRVLVDSLDRRPATSAPILERLGFRALGGARYHEARDRPQPGGP